uniref:Family with sequence similarity 120 member B n=1 Tax=Meleagris gallopavo TaxID=9103 RepID=A0A803YB00_MELGA
MGIKGLQGFVARVCPDACRMVDLKEMAEKHRIDHPDVTPVIVVDAMSCVRHWYTPESWVCGGQWREYLTVLEDFIETFKAAGIELVFYFDGVVEEKKRDEWIKRRQQNNKEIANLFQFIKTHRKQPGRGMFVLPSALPTFTRFALKSLGQKTVCTLQEADFEVAAYGLQHNCMGILGQDITVMYSREDLCRALGLNIMHLPLFACLLGNDVVPENLLEGFWHKCLVICPSRNKSYNRRTSIILAVANYISKIPCLYSSLKHLEDMLPLGSDKTLLHRGMESYLLPGQQSPWIPPDARNFSMFSGQEETAMCQDKEIFQVLCTKYGWLCPCPVQFKVRCLRATLLLFHIRCSRPAVPIGTLCVQMCPYPVSKEHHIQSENYAIFNILSNGELECSNSLEDDCDTEIPGQALIYRPARQHIYSVLLESEGDGACPVVKEWFVYCGNPLQQPDLIQPVQPSIPGGTPNLKTLWFAKGPDVEKQRYSTFLACFHLQDAMEELQALEAPVAAFCCLLTYLMLQVSSLSLEDLNAFVALVLCLRGKSAAELASLQLMQVDSRAVHLGAVLVRGLTTLLMANSACGFPFRMDDLMPWKVFDGKLFQEKYQKSHRSCSLEELLEGNVSNYILLESFVFFKKNVPVHNYCCTGLLSLGKVCLTRCKAVLTSGENCLMPHQHRICGEEIRYICTHLCR